MRKIICGALLCLGMLVPAFGQKTLHGAGDPRLQNPIPSCVFDKAYIDDTTGNQYTAAGYPCKWTTGSTNGLIYPGATLAADGVTDDTVAFQAQVNAAEAAGTVLMLPPNKTILLTGSISISGVVLWQGNNSTLSFQPTSATSYSVGGSSITRLDIGGITFQGNGYTNFAVGIAGGTNTNISIHNDTFTNFNGCTGAGGLTGDILLSGATNVKIKDNYFLAGGCSGIDGAAIFNYTNPSYNWDISGNYINNTYFDYGFLLFNLFESTIHDNDIQNVPTGSNTGATGYGIAIYGTGVCGTATLASPSGLVRNSSNVTTMSFSGSCSPAIQVGDHLAVNSATSVGGTQFNDGYTVTAATSSTITATSDSGIAWGADTGGAGNMQYSPRLNTIHHNRIKNTGGMGIYVAGDTDSAVDSNVFSGVCQTFNDSGLPCGFVSVNGGYRISVGGNVGAGSAKDGIVTSGPASGSGVGNSIYGNDLAGITNGALRVRGPNYGESWFGNTVYGGLYGVELDGASQSESIAANAITGSSSELISLGNSSTQNHSIVANNLNCLAMLSNSEGVGDILGNLNIFALNYASRCRGDAFDMRGVNNLIALNFTSGGGSISMSTNNGSYNMVTDNYLYQPLTGFNDNGAGQLNVIRNNYVAQGTTPFGTINGMLWGNTSKGGAGGAYPLGSCTLVAGTCTITTAEVQSTDSGKIYCTRGSTGSNPGFPYVSSITAGTSFVVTSTNASDTGNVGCRIQH